MPKHLDVWLLGEHVGQLMQVDGRIQFAYSAQWLAQPAHSGGVGGPLSQSLPLRAAPFDDRATRPFFAGLLPEGEPRRLAAQALQVSRQNDFGLLGGLGGECAGAVTLLEPGKVAPEAQGPHAVRWLSDDALAGLLAELPQRPLLAGQEDGLRLSLAGAQDKLPVVWDGHRMGLPLNGAPSTHILKPPIAGVAGSVLNEAFCMTLAGALRLPVATVAVQQLAGRPCLLVQRYDRAPGLGEDAAPIRLHQEDFCQALGVPPEHKYQNEGGPGLAQAFALLRRATRPSAPHVLRLLDAVVFNALIGNHDAHGKNFSLLYGPQGAGLAPMYDLLCTAVYPRLSDKMAMKLGSQYRYTAVKARHWAQFAEASGLSPALVKKRVLDLAKRLPAVAAQHQQAVESSGAGHAVVTDIVALIAQRCALTTQRLMAAPDSADIDIDIDINNQID